MSIPNVVFIRSIISSYKFVRHENSSVWPSDSTNKIFHRIVNFQIFPLKRFCSLRVFLWCLCLLTGTLWNEGMFFTTREPRQPFRHLSNPELQCLAQPLKSLQPVRQKFHIPKQDCAQSLLASVNRACHVITGIKSISIPTILIWTE